MPTKVAVKYNKDLKIQEGNFNVNKIPDFCPVCHIEIKPLYRYAWLNDKILDEKRLQIIFLCPNENCQKLFISYYRPPRLGERHVLDIDYYYNGSAPGGIRKKVFPEEIAKISPKFCKIYNQAKEAEERRLKEICGAGYRRALEFLIKDYLIKEKVEKAKIIQETPLGTCIDKYVASERIKDCAKRAAWLGNDETHYIRIWEDKDLEDLKDLIELTVNWIRDEHLTRRIKKEMPERKTKAKK